MKYVIIGNSTAAVGAVEGIRQLDSEGSITIISNEPHHTYSRPLISYLLLGKATEETIKYRPDSFYKDNNCTLVYANAVKIDPKAKTVHCELRGNGDASQAHRDAQPQQPYQDAQAHRDAQPQQPYQDAQAQQPQQPHQNTHTQQGAQPQQPHRDLPLLYDKLLVATGSSAFVPPFEGLDTVKEKHTFMTLDDARNLSAALSPEKSVLIIGAGLIGLKCAEGIAGKVRHITVLDLAPGILSSILDENGAKLVRTHLESAGLEFKLSCSVKRFDGNTAILDDGGEIDFDILVLAVGVRPNTSLLAGIADIDKGILIDGMSQTSAKDIYAAGDCTQSVDISSGQSKIMALLPNAYMQGECAGVNMAGGGKSFDKAAPMNAIGFHCGGSQTDAGIPALHIITAGSYEGDEYISADADAKRYKRLFYSGNRLKGYIMIGDVDKAGIYTSLIREQTALDSIDFALICERPGLMAFTKEDRSVKLGGAGL